MFVTCAGSECLLWAVPEQALQGNGTTIAEVVQPAKILDLESSNAVQDICAMEVMKGAVLVLVTTQREQFVFLAKLKADKNKSKIKKADCHITLGHKQHEVVCSTIVDEETVSTIEGHAFSLNKHVINLVEGGAIRKEVKLGSGSEDKVEGKSKQNAEDYRVVALDEER